VITENQRVLEAVEAMKDGNLSELGKLLYASHESLKNDYEVSTPEIDLLVEYAKNEPHIFGARLTGGGFGGSVLFALEPGNEQLLSDIADRYQRKTGLAATRFA
jgi:galactokinase